MSLKDFFIKLVNKEISFECNITVTNSEEIEQLTKDVGIYIHYQLKTDITTTTPASQNGFAILMQNVCKSKLYLAIFSQSGNHKQTLRNDLVD
ncbi:hypothetical protein RhiirA1_461307 [Rhizophagus irregularis]|uniref:Uncharacterized protein n=1 Tax=Rhizophagus irregularis TaxID=588596 RepID=A0A2I1EKL1_9GLOM|nr:hypothetical protein RhiirA1_461307 [Rhizophagus irregularis]PKY22659.1 hypothetical protein RhiirB3_436672 [Rhizophagus irregularis]